MISRGSSFASVNIHRNWFILVLLVNGSTTHTAYQEDILFSLINFNHFIFTASCINIVSRRFTKPQSLTPEQAKVAVNFLLKGRNLDQDQAQIDGWPVMKERGEGQRHYKCKQIRIKYIQVKTDLIMVSNISLY